MTNNKKSCSALNLLDGRILLSLVATIIAVLAVALSDIKKMVRVMPPS